MGKRKKLKGRSYTIPQFVEIVCKQCKYCEKQGLKDIKASFCYPIFKSNAWGFCAKTVPRIKQIEKNPRAFEDIFCKECDLVCDYGLNDKQECKNFQTCLNAFKTQIGLMAIKGNDLKLKTFSNIKKSIKPIVKKKEPYRVEIAYPTMFHGGSDPSWAKFIRDAVEDAYINDTHTSVEQNSNIKTT